jgi:alanine racemase
MSRTAVAILSTENLHHNIRTIKANVPSSKIIAMVKANAYGHGIRSTSMRLEGHVDILGVASIDEAIALRKAGIKTPIMLAEGVFEPSELVIASAENFHVVFHSQEQLGWLNNVFMPNQLQAWLKINTGMGRLGFNLNEAKIVYDKLSSNSKISLPVRVMSHFACADEPLHELNQIQMNNFANFIKGMNTECSICNSAGIFSFPDFHYDYVRPGIAIYGISPFSDKSGFDLNLKPVMTLTSTLIAVNKLKKGDYIGYGGRFRCPENMPVGIIAFGYGDGYPITARDGTPVIVKNTKCSLVGRVSMDMMAVDLRECGDAKVGDPIYLWGDGLPVEELAKYTANITGDMLTGLHNRVRFIWSTIN